MALAIIILFQYALVILKLTGVISNSWAMVWTPAIVVFNIFVAMILGAVLLEIIQIQKKVEWEYQSKYRYSDKD